MNYTADQYMTLLQSLLHWKDKIEVALEKGGNSHSFDDVVEMVMRGSVVMFPYPDCFLLMELIHQPQFKVWHCFIAGGKMEAVIEAEAPMMEIARATGCKYLSFSGRDGWPRMLQSRGWHTVCTTMHKEVL